MDGTVGRIACGVVAFGVLAMLLGAVDARADGQTIHGCIPKKGGRLRVLGATGKCKKSETALDFNTVGPAGTPAWQRPCPPDSALVGTVCVDLYEASVWSIGAGNPLIDAVKNGTATLANLNAGGAVQRGCTAAPFSMADFPSTFPATGDWTTPLYAASVAGVLPTTCISWFQAEQACALAGKRLLTNQEWQRATAGTPATDTDDGSTTCAKTSSGPALTGARSACVSSWGIHDLPGNVWEMVADWGDFFTGLTCGVWSGDFGGDAACVAGDGSNAGPLGTLVNFPAATLRGGRWAYGGFAGSFTISNGGATPDEGVDTVGFRCAR